MAKTADAFRDLVKNAPIAPSPVPLRVTGAVGQGTDAEHFVLTLAGGEQVTLPIAAVTDHDTMGGAFGQTLVSLALDPTHIPAPAAATLRQSADGQVTSMILSGGGWDRKLPGFDYHPQAQGAGPGAPGGTMPFALATPHQADAKTIAEMKAMEAAAYAPSGALIKHPGYDKTPRQDGTYPTAHGWHSDY